MLTEYVFEVILDDRRGTEIVKILAQDYDDARERLSELILPLDFMAKVRRQRIGSPELV